MNICKIIVSVILSIGLLGCNKSVDIRNEYLRNGITDEDINKGKELLNKMEIACGGKENWNKYKYGEFKQSADWYGRVKLSNWDTLPQIFIMVCELESNNSEMLLLNGKNKGTIFKIANESFSEQRINKKKAEVGKNRYYNKMIF